MSGSDHECEVRSQDTECRLCVPSNGKLQWLTTAPNPNVRGYGADDGQRGWRLHAVAASDDETLESIAFRPSVCGIFPAHGWGMDMFIDRECVRCLRALGVACRVCNGRGRVGKAAESSTCSACFGKGRNQ